MTIKKKLILSIPNPFYILQPIINKISGCKHEEWDSDNIIRTIRCRGCGKKAWIKEYKNLYQ